MLTGKKEGYINFRTSHVLSVSAAHAFHDTYTAFLSPLIPRLIEKFSLLKQEASVLSVVMQLPSLLQPVIGHLMEERAKRWVVILSPLATSLLMSFIGIAPSFGMIALILLFTGISSAFLHAVTPVLMGELSGNRLGKGMGFWMVGGETGRTLGPIIIVTFISYYGLDGMYQLIFPAMVISFLLFMKIRSIEEKTTITRRQSTDFRLVLRRLRPVLLPLSVIILMRSMAVGSLNVFLPTYLTEKGSSLVFSGVSLSVYESAGIAGAFLGGWLSDHLGRKSVLYLAFSTAPFLIILSLHVNNYFLYPVLLLLGLSILSTGSVILALVQESCPENKSFANGLFMAISFILRSVGIIAAGVIADYSSLYTTYLTSAGLMLLGVTIIHKLPSVEKEKRR